MDYTGDGRPLEGPLDAAARDDLAALRDGRVARRMDALGFTAATDNGCRYTAPTDEERAAAAAAAVCRKCSGIGRVYGQGGLLPACPKCGLEPA
mgnify:CR=1 FL=1